jgi:hypothetical protein
MEPMHQQTHMGLEEMVAVYKHQQLQLGVAMARQDF